MANVITAASSPKIKETHIGSSHSPPPLNFPLSVYKASLGGTGTYRPCGTKIPCGLFVWVNISVSIISIHPCVSIESFSMQYPFGALLRIAVNSEIVFPESLRRKSFISNIVDTPSM